MGALRLSTAGESHGAALVALLEGVPSGLPLDAAWIDARLALRQRGYGRGGRMRIEQDHVEIVAGVRAGRTTGAPLALVVRNRDATLEKLPPVTRPRPGHADLPGMLKHGIDDARDVLERASARETAARVAAGAVAERLLDEFGVQVVGFVRELGPVSAGDVPDDMGELLRRRDASDFLCPDPAVAAAMRGEVDAAHDAGDTVGGIVEVRARGLVAGLGGYASAGDRLDGRLAAALCRVQAVKGVEIGLGFEAARRRGSAVHDEIVAAPGGGTRRTRNNAGGIEGGMTTGEDVVVRAAMKPISTLRRALRSVDVRTGESVEAAWERSDTCAVPALAVIAQAVVALELASALLEKTGGDALPEVCRNLDGYRRAASELLARVRHPDEP